MSEAVSAVAMADSIRESKQTRTVVWVISLAFVGLLFDGYDLVVYGACVSTFLRDVTQLGAVTPAIAGQLGSYALFGVLVGALLAGSVGDIIGRRKIMLFAYAWFSIGMAVTALTSSVTAFGIMRFLTGAGVGALLATTAALVAEFAPKGKKNLCNAIVYCGVPAGSLMAAALAIVLMNMIGWRGLFMVGALPLITLLPLAYFKMPESVVWLAARGRIDEARTVAERTGIDMVEAAAPSMSGPIDHGTSGGKASWAGLFTSYPLATFLLGLMSGTGLLLVYSLNTWLPELMLRAGFNAKGSLSFLMVLNGGAVVGALLASKAADRIGAKRVVAACFALGALAILPPDRGLPAWYVIGRRGARWSRNKRHTDVDLRAGGEFLPNECPRRRRGLVCRLRPFGRRGRSCSWRLPGWRRFRARVHILRSGQRGGNGRRSDHTRSVIPEPASGFAGGRLTGARMSVGMTRAQGDLVDAQDQGTASRRDAGPCGLSNRQRLAQRSRGIKC